jgi:hypothetical protein
MKLYKAAWLIVCAAVGLVGVSVMLLLSPPAFVFLFLSFGIVAIVVTQAVSGRSDMGSRRERLRRLITAALIAGTAAGAFVGLAVILGAGVLLLVACLVVSSPTIVHAYGRWLASTSGDGVRHLDAIARAISYAGAPTWTPVQPVLGPRSLSDQQLRQTWQNSYLTLQERPTVSRAMAIVEERAMQLAEFERRNPAGFTMWLASGASAAGIPLTYLVERRAACPGINWDEPIPGQEW